MAEKIERKRNERAAIRDSFIRETEAKKACCFKCTG
jgi:hypothetical protein